MKKLIILSLIFTVNASTAAARPVNDAPQDQCSAEGKQALYADFLKVRETDQAKAYDYAKKYLGCPAGEVTEAGEKIIDYLKKYSAAYDKGMRKVRYRVLLYNERKYAEAYQLGKEVLTDEPDNLKVLVDLGANGYLVGPLNDRVLTAQAVTYARMALEQLEAGKTIQSWDPIANRDMAVAYLNYTIGSLTLENEPSSALKNLIQAVQTETPLKKSPYTYAYIAGAYETGDYQKLSAEYKKNFSGRDETPESKSALENLNQIVDRMIDSYARAVALAGNDANFASQKPIWNERLSTWYKFRNNGSDAGLTEFVSTVVAKPLPQLPTPRTTP